MCIITEFDVHTGSCFMNSFKLNAENNGRSTDNVQPDYGLDWSNSRLAGHFDRSFLDTNIAALH